MLSILLGYAISIGVLNHPRTCCMHIGSTMTENVPEADLEYAEVTRHNHWQTDQSFTRRPKS
jgi:hypothetical protein